MSLRWAFLVWLVALGGVWWAYAITGTIRGAALGFVIVFVLDLSASFLVTKFAGAQRSPK